MSHEVEWEACTGAGLRFCEQGHYDDAERAFLSALQETENLSPLDPRLSISLNNLATLYHEQGRCAEAELFYQRALTLMKQVMGADNSNVTQILRNLAMLYEVQGRHAEAKSLHKKAAEIRISRPTWMRCSHPVNRP